MPCTRVGRTWRRHDTAEPRRRCGGPGRGRRHRRRRMARTSRRPARRGDRVTRGRWVRRRWNGRGHARAVPPPGPDRPVRRGDPGGRSTWAERADSRADVHRLRARCDTIMVGVGTVLTADDPHLDGSRRSRRAAFRTAAARRTSIHPGALRCMPGCLTQPPRRGSATADDVGRDPNGKVDLRAVLRSLHARGRQSVLLEGGADARRRVHPRGAGRPRRPLPRSGVARRGLQKDR